jgi:hypothetical protein
MNTILQAIKLTPRFLFQIYSQPSKVIEFIDENENNTAIYSWSIPLQSVFLGIIIAIPHLMWYNNIVNSIVFAFAVAVAGAVAFAVAGAVAFAVAVAGAGVGAFVFAGGFVSVVAFKGAGLGVFSAAGAATGAGAFAFVFAGVGAFAGAVADKPLQKSYYPVLTIVFNIIVLFFIVAIGVGEKDIQLKNVALTLPLGYFAGYFFASSLIFARIQKAVKTKHNESIVKSNDLYISSYQRIQYKTLLWCLIFSISAYALILFIGKPERSPTLITIAIGFATLPLFMLHIPDYLFCLPVWKNQRKKILRQSNNPEELIHQYEKALPFKYERLYFPLPGLHKIITAISDHPQLGPKEAIKQITHLYLFTFQQKEALKAFHMLWQENDPHLLIHYLLEAKNIPLLKILSKTNPMAGQYLELLEDKSNLQDISAHMKLVMNRDSAIHLPMVHSLDAAHRLLTTDNLKNFYSAVTLFKEDTPFPDELKYFYVLNNMADPLIKITNNLKKAADIERIETKRGVLTDQHKHLETLSELTASTMYEPFANIWKKALTHIITLIQKEIDLLKGSAIFDIHLVNQEILSGSGKQTLHFDITNKGQELGSDVSIALQADNSSLTVQDHDPQTFPYFETNQTKKINFPVTLNHPGKATIKIALTYSDLTRENKQETFSFPITITEKQTAFKKIPNPYIAGPALRKESPLFMGREDIYRFVDENIIPKGQHHTIVCHGLRRTGKSSLLYQIEQQGFTDKRLIPINIDIQGIADERDLYLTLSEKIIKKLALSAINPVDNFGDFKRFISQLNHSSGIVLMLDEFEELQMRVEEKRISRTVFSNIRHLMQHEDHIIFLFCGTHKIEEMQADYWSIFFNTALYKRIGSLPRADAIRLIREPVKEGLHYDDLAVEQILSMTGCQPYLIQLICRTIVNDLNNNKKRNDALVNDVDDAVEQIIAEDNDNFSKEAWKDAKHLERMILSATAEELTRKHLEKANIEDIMDKVAGQLKNFSRDQGVDILDKLVTGEILVEKNLNYRFNIDMTRQWIATRHPLRKVRE